VDDDRFKTEVVITACAPNNKNVRHACIVCNAASQFVP